MADSQFTEVREILRERKFGRLFAGDTQNTLIQFFRYVFVGGLATVVDWVVSYVLFRFVFGGHYAVLANSLSFTAGLAVNYIISTLWIFKSSGNRSKITEFLGFAGIGLVGLFITIGITKLFEVWLSSKTGLFQIIAKAVSTAVSFLWNFFARKLLLFSDKTEEG